MATKVEVTTLDVDSPKTSWKRHIWDSLDKSKQERRFLLKLDLTLLTFGCLGFFTKFLNQTNMTNAFVSGMKEDLDMFGNQLNYATTAFTVGYIIGEIPSNVLLTRIRPSIYIPTLQVVYTGLTLCSAGITNTTQLYVLRFLIGLAEAGYYPGLQYMIGSWYRKDEMAKRACILNASGSLAMLFSGFLMTAVTGLGGRGSLPGWKWLFIMDGVISFPIALASFYFLPDLPETTGRRIFTEEEIELAQRRMVLAERKSREPFSRRKIKKVLTSWHIYLLSFYYVFISGSMGTPVFPQYLKLHVNPKYTVQQINLYPSGLFAIQAVSAVVYAWISDTVLKGSRWTILFFGAVINLIVWSSLAAWDIPEGWKWTCYYIAGQHVGLSGIVFTWANEICTDDSEERAIVLATMNTMVGVVSAWLPLIVWQQIDAPKYHKGFITASCMGAVALFIIPTMRLLQNKETAR
ncbi:MFS general substrate transporter [Coniochaeta sp. PMI_546]|nr:MFS general substrate transporter [Coniochaeta sp. PMI_546]